MRDNLIEALCQLPHGSRTPLALLPRLARVLTSGTTAAHTALAVPVIYVLRRIARHSAALAGARRVLQIHDAQQRQVLMTRGLLFFCALPEAIVAERGLLERLAKLGLLVPWPPQVSPWLPTALAPSSAPAPYSHGVTTAATPDDPSLLPALVLGLLRTVAQASRAAADALMRAGVLTAALRFIVPDVLHGPDTNVGAAAVRETVRADVRGDQTRKMCDRPSLTRTTRGVTCHNFGCDLGAPAVAFAHRVRLRAGPVWRRHGGDAQRHHGAHQCLHHPATAQPQHRQCRRGPTALLLPLAHCNAPVRVGPS